MLFAPDGEKYLFRFFKTRYLHDLDGNTINNKLIIGSPYRKNYRDIYKVGDTLKAPDSRDKSPSLRPSFYYKNMNEELPHKGWSVVGVADPMYSLYNIPTLRSRYMNKNSFGLARDGDDLILEPAYKRVPKDALVEMFITNVLPYTTADDDLQEEELSKALDEYYNTESLRAKVPKLYLDNWKNLDKRFDDLDRRYLIDLKNIFKHQNSSAQDYNNKIALLNRYDKLLNMLYTMYRDKGYWGDLWLASAPESALYKADDYIKGKNRAQFDFPEEMRVKNIRLLRHMDKNPKFAMRFLNDLETFMNDMHRYDNSLQPIVTRRQQYPQSVRQEEPVDGEFLDTINKMNDNAMNIIVDNFQIDPRDIASDELCKTVWMDMSNWYNKNKRQHNIVNGLSGGDNKWR